LSNSGQYGGDAQELLHRWYKGKFVKQPANKIFKYITVEDLGSSATALDKRPALSSSDLTNGDDGLTGIDDNQYIGDSSQQPGM
jgi:hypothetical protein